MHGKVSCLSGVTTTLYLSNVKVCLLMTKEVAIIEGQLSEIMAKYHGIVGAALCGSSARGEEAYIINQGRKKIYSDVDFLIVTKCIRDVSEIAYNLQNDIRMAKENKRIKEITDKHFEFSYSIYPYTKLNHLDRRFIHFETKFANKQFYGETNIIKIMPDITISNLNWAELLTIPLHRMVSVIKESFSTDSLYKYYLVCRNMLDILTVIFPFEGYLIPTYKLRLCNIEKVMGDMRVRAFFNVRELSIIMNHCFQAKIYPQVHQSNGLNYVYLLDIFIDSFRSLKRYLEFKRGRKVFPIDMRSIFRSLKCRSISGINKELKKPGQLLMLYRECLTFLEGYAQGKPDQHLFFKILRIYEEIFS
jgi:predicted nucleotidyltransferase